MPDVSDHSYRYTFSFADGQNIVCQVNLDPVTLDYLPPAGQELPDWAHRFPAANPRSGSAKFVAGIDHGHQRLPSPRFSAAHD